MRFFLAIAALILMSAPALAKDSAVLEPCFKLADDKVQQCIADIANKTTAELEKKEATLKKNYSANPKKLAAFETAQKSWRKALENDCQYIHYESLGGSAEGDYLNSCEIAYTLARTKLLQSMIDNP